MVVDSTEHHEKLYSKALLNSKYDALSRLRQVIFGCPFHDKCNHIVR